MTTKLSNVSAPEFPFSTAFCSPSMVNDKNHLASVDFPDTGMSKWDLVAADAHWRTSFHQGEILHASKQVTLFIICGGDLVHIHVLYNLTNLQNIPTKFL